MKFFQALDEKVTYFNLEFFAQRTFQKRKFEFLNENHILQEVPSEAVFCYKSFKQTHTIDLSEDSDFISYEALHVFNYKSGSNLIVEVPKFRGVNQLGSSTGVFHTAKQHRQLTNDFQEYEDRFQKHVKEQLDFKHPEGEINTPVPRHEGCGVCNAHFKDFKAHVKSREHKKMVDRQTNLLSQIDSLIETMDEDVKKMKNRTLIVNSRRKYQNLQNKSSFLPANEKSKQT